jgi:hypothetical protein
MTRQPYSPELIRNNLKRWGANLRRETNWETAALLKDRTRRAIRERLKAGESVASLAKDYDVPTKFVRFLGSPQMFQDNMK